MRCSFAFSDLSHDPRSFCVCEHYVLPRDATVNDYAPDAKNEEEESEGASNRGKDDGERCVNMARLRIGVMCRTR